MQIAIDDTKLNVTAAGSGDAVVLLHGFPFSHEIWKSQIESISKSNFVVAPDLRGLGKSEATGGPYLMETLAGDLAAVLDALGVERATVIGHSLGGYVALAFFRMFSERVLRLGLIASRMDADSPQVAKNRLNMADEAESSGMQPFIERNMDSYFANESRPEIRATIIEIMKRTDPQAAAAMLRGMALRVSSEDLIDELKLPVLIVAGVQDEISPPGIWDTVLPRLPAVRVALFEHSAHLPMVEEPGRLSADLANFLQTPAGRN